MVRTRDVLLVMVSIGFVLIVLVGQFGRGISHQSIIEYSIPDSNPVETTGAEFAGVADERTERISQWRERLRDFEIPVIEPEIATVPEADLDIETVTEVLTCNDFLPYNVVAPKLYSFEAEGVRVFSSVEQVELVDSSNTFLVVPIRVNQTGTGQYCLSSDVIGIANNGTLIRNSQVTGYGVFDPDTLIGYALDGFPIYGRLPDSQLDDCGGIMTSSGYQYHIATEREEILRCFGASPVALP